jgi:hypothetical protein
MTQRASPSVPVSYVLALGSADVAIVTSDEGGWILDGHRRGCSRATCPRGAGLRWGHPETLDADVHAQVMGIDLDTSSGHPEEPEAGTHAQTIGEEPDLPVGQPDDLNEGEDAQLASVESGDLLGA